MIRRIISATWFQRPEAGSVPARWSELSVLIGLTCILTLSSCHLQNNDRILSGSAMSSHDGPTVRVRIRRDQVQINLDSDGQLAIGQTIVEGPQDVFWPPVRLRRRMDGFQIVTGTGIHAIGGLSTVRIVTRSGQSIRIDGRSYPGEIWLHGVGEIVEARFDVVNHVPMEQYLPGVLARELYRHWHPATYRAQAIAARSYALSELARRKKIYDVESTTSSQVYGGQTQHKKALDAVRATHGLILTYSGNVLPAYYSSCCGGVGQDASLAFPYGIDVPPLQGRHHGVWCAQSRLFRWGPISRSRLTLARRIAAWGQAQRAPIGELKGLRWITITHWNRVGRPAQFTIVDDQNRSFILGPESFRWACNCETPELPPLSPNQKLHSSDVRVTMGPDAVVFTEGHGHGHGVGMCQHGSEALAQANYTESSILSFFYRGATIEQLY